MALKSSSYSPKYANSWALVIGINKYQRINQLNYAYNDADAVAKILVDQFSFPKNQVTLLTDDQATRDAILEQYLQFTGNAVGEDDRIVVFFAGHGYTQIGKRGEVGFLVPVDGNPNEISSLIRWNELTINADLIPAKHLLYIIDACYGGLAITRSLQPGSSRFLKDMLLRYSRQVITAGKANEPVMDAGGPLPNHSVFTGHFLQALAGNAAAKDGIITANGVMAYVYEKVSKDYHSQQTPHFGYLDGDGDFIFAAPVLDSLSGSEKIDRDILVSVPAPAIESSNIVSNLDLVKEYIGDTRYLVKLHDLALQETRQVIAKTSVENFPIVGGSGSPQDVLNRLNKYEAITKDIEGTFMVLTYWGKSEHLPIVSKIISLLTEQEMTGGATTWLALRYYPSLLLVYVGGIASLFAENYSNLATILTTCVGSSPNDYGDTEIILRLGEAITNYERSNIFKILPGHENHYVPRSEYLFKLLQPSLEDILFLGKRYEDYFDRFEIFLALVYADLTTKKNHHLWGPIGRFGWKYHSSEPSRNPYIRLLEEAKSMKDNWPPLKAGLFSGSFTRFEEIATGFQERIARLGWF